MLARPLIVTTIDLPPPVSTNRLWRVRKASTTTGRMASKSPEYRRWIEQADKLSIALAQFRGTLRIDGPFEADVVIKVNGLDLDNCLKGLLDFCQSRALIADDKNCRRILLEYGDAPHGAKITLRELPA